MVLVSCEVKIGVKVLKMAKWFREKDKRRWWDDYVWFVEDGKKKKKMKNGVMKKVGTRWWRGF